MTDLALETKGLRKTFGDLVAVDGIDLDVPRGSFYGFLGPNGAGKSTTIKCLTGLLRPTAGTFRDARDRSESPIPSASSVKSASSPRISRCSIGSRAPRRSRSSGRCTGSIRRACGRDRTSCSALMDLRGAAG